MLRFRLNVQICVRIVEWDNSCTNLEESTPDLHSLALLSLLVVRIECPRQVPGKDLVNYTLGHAFVVRRPAGVA